MKEQLEVKCDGSDVLYAVLSYMYSGTIILTEANVCGILKLAVTFHLFNLKSYCSNFLESAVKSSNCLDVYELARRCLFLLYVYMYYYYYVREGFRRTTGLRPNKSDSPKLPHINAGGEFLFSLPAFRKKLASRLIHPSCISFSRLNSGNPKQLTICLR